MSSKVPAVHKMIHVVLLIVSVGLSSLYLQLRVRYEELAQSCAMSQKTVGVDCSGVNHCPAGQSDDMGIFPHRKLFSSTTMLVFQMSSSSSSRTGESSDKSYQGTEIITDTHHELLSISQSLFDSSDVPFETSESTLVMNEHGQAQGPQIKLPEFSTYATTTEEILNTSYMEVTKVETQAKTEKDIDQNTSNGTPTSQYIHLHPSTAAGDIKLRRKDSRNLDELNLHQATHERSTTSVTEGQFITFQSATSFQAQSLATSVSETIDSFKWSAKRHPTSEKSNLDLTHSGTENQKVANLMDNFVTATENWSGSHDLLSVINFCEWPECTMADDAGKKDIPSQYVLYQVHGQSEDHNGENEQEDGVPLSNLFRTATPKVLDKLISQGTSASCTSGNAGKSCHFQNLCYNTANHEFVFLKGEKSFIKDPSLKTSTDFSAMFDINLSTVPDHNAHRLSLSTIPSESLHRFSLVSISQWKSILMSRFKPDNIMHVLHDDVLPLFHTLHSLNLMPSPQKSNVAIVFTDQLENGDFINFYSAVSSICPGPLWKLNQTAEMLCFSDAFVGISTSTLWYQYGFFTPQGPMQVQNTELVSDVHRAVGHLSEYFQSPCFLCKKRDYLVLLSRKDNRLILNEGELILSLARATKLKVMSVSLETHSLSQIISTVQNSKGLIGMHGSLFIFLIFLYPGSIVIELFPYGVNHSRYTPFKTFCDFPASGIVYKSWTNTDKSKSRAHPDWSPEMGGIDHLPRNVQEVIVSQTDVPEHLCCEDPSWLYHIYQDTEVSVQTVVALTVDALSLSSLTEANNLHNLQIDSATKTASDLPLVPGKVGRLLCQQHSQQDGLKRRKFTVVWHLPWNLEFISYEMIQIQLVIQKSGSEIGRNTEIPVSVLQYSFDPWEPDISADYNVWVRVTLDHDRHGPYAYVICKNER